MALEKLWREILPINIIGAGPRLGSLLIQDSTELRVGMEVILKAVAKPDFVTEIKSINNNIVYFGKIGVQNQVSLDVSDYVHGTIQSPEQVKKVIPEQDQSFDRYERGPTNADRSVLVDRRGEYYTLSNPLDVRISDVEVNADLSVKLTHLDNYPNLGDIADSVRIGDGTDELAINSDGSINAKTNIVSIDGTRSADVTVDNALKVDGSHVTQPISGDVNATIIGDVNAIITNPVTIIPDPAASDFFGEQYTIPINPVVQLDARYGISLVDTQTYKSGGGNVTTENSSFIATCSSTTGSYGLIRSRRFNPFKAGQTLLARWYAKFDTPTLGTSQRLGIQNQENAYWFGYNGTRFGFCHTYGGKAPIYKITINSYTGTQTLTITLNGVPYTVSIQNGETINDAANRISTINFNGTWLVNQRDNTVELLSANTAPAVGGFNITSTGNLSASISQVQAGVSPTDEWFYVGDPNGPVLPLNCNPIFYNQYQIKYSWAGVSLFLLNFDTNKFEVIFRYSHTDTDNLKLTNPAFKIAILSLNTGGNTPVSVKAAAMMMSVEGVINRNNYTGSVSSSKVSLASNTLHQILSIQNPYTYNGVINTKEIILEEMAIATQCNDPSQIYLFLDAGLSTGIENFITQDSQPVTVSFSPGTILANTYFPIASLIVGNTGSVSQFSLGNYRVTISPGMTLTIAILSTATIQRVAASIVWYND